jgi:hypothetical protein
VAAGEADGDGAGPLGAGDELAAVDEPSDEVVSWPTPPDELEPDAAAEVGAAPVPPLDPRTAPALPDGEPDPAPIEPPSDEPPRATTGLGDPMPGPMTPTTTRPTTRTTAPNPKSHRRRARNAIRTRRIGDGRWGVAGSGAGVRSGPSTREL